MSTEQLAAVVCALTIITGAAHLVGYVFSRLRQPKLIGELLAGVLLGPFVLGQLAPEASKAVLGSTEGAGSSTRLVLGFVHWLGLLLLMFISGSEVRRVFGRENHTAALWMLAVGKGLPFVLALLLCAFLPTDALAGPVGRGWPIRLVLAIAVAVTSIPVLSRIFYDFGILHTRFAGLVLGVALLEDVALWGVLAIAMASAKAGHLDSGVGVDVVSHIGVTIAFMAFGLLVAPRLLSRFQGTAWNVLHVASPTGYSVLVLLAYSAIAAVLGVNLVFAAFLAGLGLVGGIGGSSRVRFAEPLDAVQKVGTGLFIPAYFALVGAKLEFGAGFSMELLGAFLIGSSALCFGAMALASFLSGFRGIEIINLALVSNARGGPGIVVASLAYEGHIINGTLFTALVLTAVLSAQLAGIWLGVVLRKGLPLLRGDVATRPPGAAASEGGLSEPTARTEPAPI